MRRCQSLSIFSAASLIALAGAGVGSEASAVTVSVVDNAEVRVVSNTTNSRDDNNGGNTASVIGINTGGIDNFAIYGFDISAVAGQTASGDSTVSIGVNTGFANGNHGSAADTINLHEIFLPNVGWIEGGGNITGADTMTDDGSVSFLNRVQYNDDPGPASGTTEPWKDAGGSDASNLLGAVSAPIDGVPGYAQGAGPASLTYTIPEATAQSWIDNGLAGLVVSVADDGDSRSRFVITEAAINFNVVPEPSSVALLGLGVLAMSFVRRRRA